MSACAHRHHTHSGHVHSARFVLCLLLILNGCAAVSTSLRDPSRHAQSTRKEIVGTGSLSFESAQSARMAGLTESQAIADGGKYLSNLTIDSPLRKAAIESELSVAKALKVEATTPEQSASEFVHAAETALAGMLSPLCNTAVNQLCDNFKLNYHRAVIGLIEQGRKHHWQNNEALGFSIVADKPEIHPAKYDSVVASTLISLDGLPNRHFRHGLGVPLTVCREKNIQEFKDKYLSQIGTCLPLTAVFEGAAETKGVSRLRILDPRFQSTVTAHSISGSKHTVPLAAGFSAPFATLTEKTHIGFFDGFFSALSSSDKLLQQTGFYSAEPIIPGKIPLITVHGLFSSPATWISLHNDLMGDELIRNNYQIFHYLYSTNLPILGNARIFREKIDELYADLEQANDGHVKPMTIVAHSMGGILTRTAVAAENSNLMIKFFRDPQSLESLEAELRSELQKYLTFSRKPYVGRAIFIAVPHRGSMMAESFIGRIGRLLISLPKKVVTASLSLAQKIRNFLKPELLKFSDAGDPSSIEGLRPTNPVLIALADTAIAQDIPFHSIIGVKEIDENGGSSDGVVAYSSSHLEGAESEFLVEADHAAHMNPLAVLEIKRILTLNVNQMQRAHKIIGQ